MGYPVGMTLPSTAAMRERLTHAGIRATAPRVALSGLLFNGRDRHITAADLHHEAAAAGHRVALATVYNTLTELVRAGLLGEVVGEGGQTWYDTRLAPHAHVVDVDTGALRDVPLFIDLSAVPLATGEELVDVQVVVRVRRGPPP